MAFATRLNGPTGTVFTTAAKSWAVPMPATVNSGDLLLIYLGHDAENTIAFDAVSGWTLVYDDSTSDVAATGRTACWKKIADGSEGGTNVTVAAASLVSNRQALAYVLRYQAGTYGTGVLADVEEAHNEGGSATPDPPSLTPSWGSGDTTWIAFAQCDGNRTTSVYPLADNNTRQSVTTDAASQMICTQQIATSPENPGTFTISVSDQWTATTLAIRGIVGGDGGGQPARTMHQQRLRRA
jgi:hypothetical protein